jgi:hypothetical protein
VNGGRQSRRNTGNFCGEDFGRADVCKAFRKIAPTGIHERGVHLMIDKTIDLENPTAEHMPIFQNTFLQSIHSASDCLDRLIIRIVHRITKEKP